MPMAARGNYLSVCALYRDEAPYLREWVEFHRLVGVERFYLYDNGSTDDHRQALAPYLADGTVVLHEWPDFPAQAAAYRHCLDNHRDDARWIAFIDVDEFLFSPTGRALPEELAEYEAWPAVVVNSCCFGTSGHVEQPPGLVIESYRWRAADDDPLNHFIKSIVDPRRAVECITEKNPHCFIYTDGFAVNEMTAAIDRPPYGRSIPVSFARLRLNHYFTRSEEEWRRKLSRPMANNGNLRAEPPLFAERMAAVEDEAIAGYAARVKEALARAERPVPDPAGAPRS